MFRRGGIFWGKTAHLSPQGERDPVPICFRSKKSSKELICFVFSVLSTKRMEFCFFSKPRIVFLIIMEHKDYGELALSMKDIEELIYYLQTGSYPFLGPYSPAELKLKKRKFRGLVKGKRKRYDLFNNYLYDSHSITHPHQPVTLCPTHIACGITAMGIHVQIQYTRGVVAREYVGETLCNAHKQGHFRSNNAYKNISSVYYWRGLYVDYKGFIAECEGCLGT